QQLRADSGGDIDGAILGPVFLPRLERLSVVADASATFRTFRRAIAKEVLAGFLVAADHVRLAARSLHLAERSQLLWVGFEPGLHFRPFDALVAVHALLEPGLQRLQQILALFRVHPCLINFHPASFENALACALLLPPDH